MYIYNGVSSPKQSGLLCVLFGISTDDEELYLPSL